jgi:uncharacterized membrane protein
VKRNQADLETTAAVAIITCAAAVAGAPAAVMTVLGIALFAAPGYLLVQLLLGPQIAGVERAAVAAGLSLCVPVIGGLALYLGGLPLHRAAWLGLLAGLTLACDLLLLWRRRRGRAAPFTGLGQWPRLGGRHAAAVGAAVLIAVCAVGLACAGAARQHYAGFTQLWLTQPRRSAPTVNLGVANYEGKTMRYMLVLWRGKRPVDTWKLTLANGQAWHGAPKSADARLTAKLYRLPDLDRAYRYVTMSGDGTG